MHATLLQLCQTLCNPTDHSLPGSSDHGIFQARILEWIACPNPGDLLDSRIKPTSFMYPALAGRFFTTSNTWTIKEQRHHFSEKGPYSQNYDFSSSHVWMWKLEHKEGWAPKNWCFWIVVLYKTLESPLDNKEIKPVSPKGNQPWISIGKTEAETEAPILWSLDAKSLLIGKDPDVWNNWRQMEKRVTEKEMVR